MIQELLPCPFCGGMPGVLSGGGLTCMNCDCAIHFHIVMDHLWNTRALPKMQKVDLDQFLLMGQNDYCAGNNKAIGLIKSKYGELYAKVKE